MQHSVEIVYCNCKIPLRVGDSLHALSSKLVRLFWQRLPYRLKIKEGAQNNVEIAYCNCKIPFWVGDGLHAFSSKLVRLMLGKQD